MVKTDQTSVERSSGNLEILLLDLIAFHIVLKRRLMINELYQSSTIRCCVITKSIFVQ